MIALAYDWLVGHSGHIHMFVQSIVQICIYFTKTVQYDMGVLIRCVGFEQISGIVGILPVYFLISLSHSKPNDYIRK